MEDLEKRLKRLERHHPFPLEGHAEEHSSQFFSYFIPGYGLYKIFRRGEDDRPNFHAHVLLSAFGTAAGLFAVRALLQYTGVDMP